MNRDNYDPWLSSEELELLPKKNCRKMNRRKIDKKKRPNRNIFTKIIPFFGCILVALGAIGIVGAFSSPFSLVGGMLYLTTGIFISLTYSSFLRQSFLKLLSPATKALLFERSLLDIVTETSPLAKGYALISMASVLDQKDIQALAEKLPEECNFLKQRGLVHLLPSSLKDIFIGNNDDNDTFMYNYNSFVTSCDHDDSLRRSIPNFIVPRFLSSGISTNDPTAHHNTPISHQMNNTETNQHSIRNHFHSRYSGHDTLHSPVTALNTPNNLTLTPVNTPFINSNTNNPQPHCDFEETLQNIINRRARITSDWLIDEFKSILSSNAYYFASGGDISDTLILRMFAVGAVGVTTAISVGNGFQLTNTNRNSNNGFESLMKFTSNYFIPYASTVTAVTGGMLAVRHFNEMQQKRSSILYKMLEKIKITYTSISTNGNPMSMYVVFAWSLTALLAWKLKRNIKNLQWVFQRILSKLLHNFNAKNF